MPSPTHLSKIAIVGATGNVGKALLTSLLAFPAAQIPTLTLLTHSPTSQFPSHPSITVHRGDYASPSFLASGFAGQDAVVFCLGFMAMPLQASMIEAAVKAGVKWILPTEYAGDGMNESLVDGVPIYHGKRAARQQVEALAQTDEGMGVKWVGVATNPWIETSLGMGLFDINLFAHKATLYPDAGRFNISTLPLVGRGMAALLTLPLADPSHPRKSLEHYANNFVYLSSFSVTQSSLIAASQKVTGTTDEDWEIERERTIEGDVSVLREKAAKGDFLAAAGLTFKYYMGEGRGGDYEGKAREEREVLGLGAVEEDLEEVVRKVVETGPLRPPF